MDLLLKNLLVIMFFWTFVKGASVVNNKIDENFIKNQSISIINEEISENRTDLIEESRKKNNGQQQDMMSRILPLLIMPFMMSTSMIPMMLVSLKFMLLQSAFIGKIAIILMLINMFRGRNVGGGVYTHNINTNTQEEKDLAYMHYGYGNNAEYGAYVHGDR